jgi:hypothetical protein
MRHKVGADGAAESCDAEVKCRLGVRQRNQLVFVSNNAIQVIDALHSSHSLLNHIRLDMPVKISR